MVASPIASWIKIIFKHGDSSDCERINVNQTVLLPDRSMEKSVFVHIVESYENPPQALHIGGGRGRWGSHRRFKNGKMIMTLDDIIQQNNQKILKYD